MAQVKEDVLMEHGVNPHQNVEVTGHFNNVIFDT